MLHNNAPWLPPHQPTAQQPPQQQQQQPQQQAVPASAPAPAPLQQQQPQLYGNPMFPPQQPQQPPAPYWPEEQINHSPPQAQQQQQALNYNNYFVHPANLQPPQQPPQQLFYPPPAQSLESFDNNNSGSKNDGWGDWGDWNESANNNHLSQHHESLIEPPNLVEDAFNVNTQDSWQAFGNNNLAEQQPPPPAEPETPSLEAIVPPRAFQNQPGLVAVEAPPLILPESVPMGGNPFKRASGLSKRVNILADAAAAAPPPEAIFGLPPPAPYGQPLPDPSATDVIYENQEVLMSAPNDERNQYLQTSHLSEQQPEEEDDPEANWEADSLSPPPGLSRLVLGQPELEEQQRLVTGTEQPSLVTPSLNVTQALHMEERQADGEDTSEGEQPAARTPPRRVVTGVEREVVLDGENLEDQEALPSLPSAPNATEVLMPPETQISHEPTPPVASSSTPRLEKKRSTPQQAPAQLPQVRPKPRPNPSLELESEDESDELLQLSERERDRRRDREQTEDRRGNPRRGHYNNYDGETEDSVRHGESKRRSQGPRHRAPEQDMERSWRRRSHKYHSGGEDQDRYEPSSRRGYGNHSNYESDGNDLELEANDLGVDGPSSSSKTSRHRRSGHAAEDDHYRRGKPQEKSTRSGRRSHEGQERSRGGDERRRRHQEQRHWDGYEEYRRKSSRNSDLEKERTNGNTTGGSSKRRNFDQYGNPVAAAYDPYGMYEQMSRNPHAYADMYAKFYGQMINSMTAAVNAAAKVGGSAPSAAAVAPLLHGHNAAGLDPTTVPAVGNEAALMRERERAGVSSSAFGVPEMATPLTTTTTGVTTTAVARPPRRRTPLLYNRPHLVASYAMSLLLKVKPKYAGRGRLRNDVEVAAPRIKDATSSLLRSYPGPLQGRKLHKDKIISFCKEQIRLGPSRGCTLLYATQKKPQGSVDKYRASHALMWHLLILLLRQNGYIADTDVGDLLLENQQEYPYNPPEVEAEPEPTNEEEQQEEEELSNAPQKEGVTATNTNSSANPAMALSEQAALDKFRSYVLRGNVEEALQWATDNNLWTHAFFLALYEDRYALTDVAQKFLNRAIKANDPLQTLYQMKSCHTPACVSQLRDEQWGDWRSHLSILVTNKSRQPEYDRSSVVALGDTLFQRGDIYAAHFCYLVAQEEFGRYDSSATEQTTLTANVPRLILLGASHYKHFNEFASNEAIIMTEIYEYARSLFDQKFSIANFQHYKFLLATRILDYGQHFRCTNYLEQIARHIELKPEIYDGDFIQRVCNLAERLRYHDPILINRVSFASPPNASNGGKTDSSAPEEKAWLRQLRALADVPLPPEPQSSDIDQQFAEVNKQFRELNMQYDGQHLEDTLHLAKDEFQQQQPSPQQLIMSEPQPTTTTQQQQEYYEPTPPATHEPTQQPPLDPYAAQLQQPVAAPSTMYYDPNAAPQQQQQLPQYAHIEQATEAYAGQLQPQPTQDHQPTLYGQPPAASTGYDYWPGTQQPPYGDEHQPQVRPAISMPKSKIYEEDENVSAKGSGKSAASGAGAASAGKPPLTADDPGAPGNQQAGWFGGLWNKLSLKPKNQMILPDDKNPTIVWDKERKCWTNTAEGNSEETESFKPPPKMTDLGLPSVAAASLAPTTNSSPLEPTSHPIQPQLYGGGMDYAPVAHSPLPEMYAAAAPSPPAPTVAQSTNPAGNASAAAAAAGGAGTQPKLQSNMFKMQRNRTLKNSYVDVFNPSGAPMSAAPDNVMAPMMAPAAVPPGGYFVPGQQ